MRPPHMIKLSCLIIILSAATACARKGPTGLRLVPDPKPLRADRELDVNKDGRPDVFEMGPVGGVTRREIDINHDGRIDVIRTYSGGHVRREEIDLDFDGKI